MKRLASLLVLAPLVILAACGGDDPGASPSPSVSPAIAASPIGTSFPAEGAHIEIRQPDDDATVKAGDVRIETAVGDFELVDKIGKAGVEGEGHIIYYLGQRYTVPTAKGQSAVSGGTGSFTSLPSASATYTWPNVPAGRHTITVQLVNNDNTPLDPPQTDSVTITVS